MITIPARNVNMGFRQGMHLIQRAGSARGSRDGHTLAVPFPVTTHYTHPWERVLFSHHRDANPFFHLFEAMWMLSGSNDARWLDRFVRNFSERYAEPGGLQHGAYGHRWRQHFEFDQLEVIAAILQQDPDSRQCILQMWDPAADLGATVRDKPCNQSVHFRVRHRLERPCLDITVFCRSNDIVMGAYGANYVHMTVMQEYMAALLGIQMGHYWQISSDYHAYIRDIASDRLARVAWADPENNDDRYLTRSLSGSDREDAPGVGVTPLFDPATVEHFYHEVEQWVEHPGAVPLAARCAVFADLLVPMWQVHNAWKSKDRAGAEALLPYIRHQDWRVAAEDWIGRRAK